MAVSVLCWAQSSPWWTWAPQTLGICLETQLFTEITTQPAACQCWARASAACSLTSRSDLCPAN